MLFSRNRKAYPEQRLLYVVNSLCTGGAEIQVVDLALRMQRRGWRVHVVTLLDRDREAVRFNGTSITRSSLRMRRGVGDPRAIFRLADEFSKFRPDVVHAHMVHSNLLARLSRVIVRVPLLISTAHNANEEGRWRYFSYRLTSRLSELTTVISRAAAEQHLRTRATPASRLRVVPNGVDLNRFHPGVGKVDKEPFVWIAVGRAEEQKDYPNMIKAFAEVAAQAPNATLRIVGSGPLIDDLHALARELALAERIEFCGVRSDVDVLMREADGYVMSSLWEGLPLVLLEAAATGLPIVATSVGGNVEVVRDGANGFLVPAADSTALADAMLRLMNLPVVERATMGQFSVATAQAFEIEAVCDRWADIYNGHFPAAEKT